MKIYQICQRDLEILGLYSQKPLFNRRTLVSFLICGLSIVLTFVFVICEASTFEEYIEATYICSAAVLSALLTVSIDLKSKTFFLYIKELENIINARSKHLASKEVYDETNRKVEKLSKIISFIGVKIMPSFGILPMVIGSYFFYFTTDLDRDAFMLAVPMWYPFDWKTPFGYLIAATVQLIIGTYGFVFFTALFSLGIGNYFFAVAINKDIKGILYAIEQNAKAKGDRAHMLNQLSEFIQFHSDSKQAIKDFCGVYQPIFASLFAWSLVTICGALLMIQMEIKSNHETNSLMMFVMSMEIYCAFCFVFVACELGERICRSFHEFRDVIGQFNWYTFPFEVQRMLPTIIHVAQQPVTLACFGSVLCLREAFKNIINSSFSYFMVLREFVN